jgi:phospholipid/cholesterol/gamma-HCH transport system substrate-binding protein
MRRMLAMLLALAGAVALLVFGAGASDDEDGGYTVRAIFDNGGFVVADEEVRIAGAKVGFVDSVDVTVGDDAAHADGSPEPGKAVVTMTITDPGFQDWREDASCLIRPQSLLGEKFVECESTQPRAPGSDAPPELSVVPDGEPGEGERFLGVEQNGKAVDLDLVNNIMREPYPDRFRLILNELGIALATRGSDIEEIIERGNPALAETNQLLALLKGQTQELNQLARDGDRSLAPLAREREHLSSFINNATIAGEATAERSADLEEGFQKMPQFFRELRSTMTQLKGFSDAATPVISDLGDAAPELTRSTEALGPFARAGREALISLGDNAEDARPDLVASEPVIKDIGRLADETEPTAKLLDVLLTDFREHNGYANLLRFFFFGTGAVNGFDSFGHYMRAVIPVNNCFVYKAFAENGCDINFNRTLGRAAREAQQSAQQDVREREVLPDGSIAELEGASEPTAPDEVEPPLDPADEGDGTDPATKSATKRDLRTMLDFFVGSEGQR